MEEFEIDFVITWVDGNDIAWQKKKHLAEHGNDIDLEATDDCRFNDNDELKYAVRSIIKNCPWYNKIYIVTDDQTPSWLNEEQDRVAVVDHRDIFDEDATLPCFNSDVIESFIHNIPNLSEHYISMNDDFFIGRKLGREFFFHDDGVPKVVVSRSGNPRAILNSFTEEGLTQGNLNVRRLSYTRKMIYEKSGFLPLNSPKHTPVPLRRSDVLALESLFREEFSEMRKSQFRNERELKFIALCEYYLISQGIETIPVVRSFNRTGRDFLSKVDYWKVSMGRNSRVNTLEYLLIYILRTAFICVNDDKVTTDRDRIKMKRFLKVMFPRKARGIEKR